MEIIQHRNIPDSELHEIKGAIGAIAGSVPVSDGTGSTAFQKLGVSSLSGSIPTAVSGIVISTDGDGGFTGKSPAYGQWLAASTAPPLSPVVWVMNPVFTPQGMFQFDSGFKVVESGYYWYGLTYLTLLTPEAGAPSLDKSGLVTVDNPSSILTAGQSGLIYLDSAMTYRSNRVGDVVSIWKVNV